MARTLSTKAFLPTVLCAALFSPFAGAQNYTAELVASGFSSPIYATAPEGDTARLFIVEQAGIVRIIRNGQLLAQPFMDISGVVGSGGERGLLGLAFHPDFLTNGRFFANYTNGGGDTRVREYRVTGDPLTDDVADGPVQLIFGLDQPFSNHNGGCIQFGHDGKLYIGTGDGGSGNDPGNRAQNPTNNLGKMIRLDVDLPSPFIPADNPFVGVAGTNDEIWALGLRNPWRFSFDRETGDMWIGDVGQNAREEIDFEPANSPGGLNYGWRCMEGFNCTGLSGCTCNDIALTLPVVDYSHAGGNCSVTGGYVYRGCVPELQGLYIYTDYCSGTFWSYDLATDTTTNITSIIDPAGGPNVNLVVSFGEDASGEMYIVDQGGGELYKIVPTGCDTSNYCTTSPNSVGAGAVISSTGSLMVFDNSFVLQAAGSTPTQFGTFYYGAGQIQVPFGDGFQCVGPGAIGQVFRLDVTISDSAGSVSYPVDFTSGAPASLLGGILGCTEWNFQWWYRDPAGPGGSGFNLSDGLNVAFCP